MESNEVKDVKDVMIVGDYELILTANPKFKFVSYRRGRKINNLLGSELAITLFNEIKMLRQKNKELQIENEKLRAHNNFEENVLKNEIVI